MNEKSLEENHSVDFKEFEDIKIEFEIYKPKDAVIYNEKFEFDFYEMNNNPTGLCLIINNEEFDDMLRTGSMLDVIRLKKLFSKLNFEVHESHNRSKKEILKEDLVKFINAIDEKHDALVLIIMSHGTSDKNGDKIYDKDNNPFLVNYFFF